MNIWAVVNGSADGSGPGRRKSSRWSTRRSAHGPISKEMEHENFSITC